ncbi:unnamed protein product [Acanthosepion pharaonis]|uniref:Uncharacterized protein n=1 Tax=Acanthosepion pharaonis TaxID=158019 RepID=A0A812CW93_ACAPH|nr:unnamed protein product [Sepia pharaonis]
MSNGARSLSLYEVAIFSRVLIILSFLSSSSSPNFRPFLLSFFSYKCLFLRSFFSLFFSSGLGFPLRSFSSFSFRISTSFEVFSLFLSFSITFPHAAKKEGTTYSVCKKARRAGESQEKIRMQLSQVTQRSTLTQASQSQEERAICLVGKAAYRASLQSSFKNAQRSRINAQAAATASASRASETHHQKLLRNVRNAAVTAKPRALGLLRHRSVEGSRDTCPYAAIATAGAAETAEVSSKCYECCHHRGQLKHLTAGAPVNPGTLLQQGDRDRTAAGNPKCPQRCSDFSCQKLQGPIDKGKRTLKGCYKHSRFELISNTPKLPAYASTATFSALRPPVVLPVPVALFGLSWFSITTLALTLLRVMTSTMTCTTTYRPKPGLVFCRRREEFLAGTSYYYFRPCQVHSYIRSFKSALENAPFPSFSIVIDADKWPHDEHKRRYNAPACNEVTAIIHGYCPQIKRRRSSQDFRDPSII